MMKTMTVSIPRKPRGLMNREGKTIFSASSRVRSSRSQTHRSSAKMGSKTPLFLLGGAANPRRPVYSIQTIHCRYVPRRIYGYSHLRKRIQAQIVGRTSNRNAVRKSVLAAVTRTLEPEFSRGRIVARIYETSQMNAGGIVSNELAVFDDVRIRLLKYSLWDVKDLRLRS